MNVGILSKKRVLLFILGILLMLSFGTIFWGRIKKDQDISTPMQFTPTPTSAPQPTGITEPTLTLTPLPTRVEQGAGIEKVIVTETASCNGETYIFDSAASDKQSYIIHIYKTKRSPETLLASIPSPYLEQTFEGKKYIERRAFSILTAPKQNCDRIYLTTILLISHPVPPSGIFEWRIGSKEMRELAVSQEFRGEYTPDFRRPESFVSPVGNKILLAQPTISPTPKEYCNFRILRLLRLREDRTEVLLRLPETETFDDGTTDLPPFCNGVRFGWLDESAVYYDVYDAAKPPPHPLKERRTLRITI